MARDISPQTGCIQAVEENVKAIKAWDDALLLRRNAIERFSDWITLAVASSPSVLVHAAWFSLWVLVNVGLVPGVRPFDKFPFQLLTTIVSLEAIFLTLFVLATQKRLSKQSELRANLDLQIDLLSEREMTAVLHLLLDIAKHLQVHTSVTADQIADLVKKTDVEMLVKEVDGDKPQR